MKAWHWVFCFFIYFSGANLLFAEQYSEKKILFVNSYHVGYEWSDGIEKGLEKGLKGTGVRLEKIYMDTKRYRGKDHIQASSQRAIKKIKEFNPDIIISADDNAAKYVVSPVYKNSDKSFIFVGVNWDASSYGFPAKNVTGMEEVALIKPIVKHLKKYAAGTRIGLLSIDAISGKKNVKHFERLMGQPFAHVYYVKSFEQWKNAYLKLQYEVDMMILENPKGITGWDNKQGRLFVEKYSKIPSATTHVWLAPYALITIAKIPEEQGEWAAKSTLKIFSGIKAGDIRVEKNKEGKLFINLRLAKAQKIIFTPSLIKTAIIIR